MPPDKTADTGEVPGGPWAKTAGTGEVPSGLLAKRPVRARSTAGQKTTADTFTVFGGPPKNGRYVYGFWRPQKKRPIRLRFLAAPKKRPIRLRFSAGPQKAADTFKVFGGPKKNGQYVYDFQ